MDGAEETRPRERGANDERTLVDGATVVRSVGVKPKVTTRVINVALMD